jgi:hypothetical protein
MTSLSTLHSPRRIRRVAPAPVPRDSRRDRGATCGAWSLVRARVGDPVGASPTPGTPGTACSTATAGAARAHQRPRLRGQPLELEAIGPRLIQATLTSEDADFFDHGGVDGRAIARAAAQNIRHGRMVSGASTITQQLVKLLDSRGRPAGPRHHRQAQRGRPRAEPRGGAEQDADPPRVPESLALRPRPGRPRGGRPRLLRRRQQGPQLGPGRVPRGAAARAVVPRPVHHLERVVAAPARAARTPCTPAGT